LAWWVSKRFADVLTPPPRDLDEARENFFMQDRALARRAD